MDRELTRTGGPGREYQYWGWYDNKPVQRADVYEALFKFFIVFPVSLFIGFLVIYTAFVSPALGLIMAYWLLKRK